MSAPPYMKLFWGDYHRDTRHLSREEHGAYFLLLGEAWNRGGFLPDDDVMLARWALATPEEWARLKPVVMALFKPARGKWRHKRIVEELANYDDVSRKRREAGKRGGSARRGKDTGIPEANAIAIAEQKPTKPEPEPEPESDKSSEDKSSGAESAEPDFNSEAWTCAVNLLRERGGCQEKAARSFFGKLLSANGLEARDLWPVIASAQVNGTRDPQAYLRRSAEAVSKRRADARPKRVGFV
jgi:uncharacterized protein YdaU (DUF1376 family)